jgi:hypothetical protein
MLTLTRELYNNATNKQEKEPRIEDDEKKKYASNRTEVKGAWCTGV